MNYFLIFNDSCIRRVALIIPSTREHVKCVKRKDNLMKIMLRMDLLPTILMEKRDLNVLFAVKLTIDSMKPTKLPTKNTYTTTVGKCSSST